MGKQVYPLHRNRRPWLLFGLLSGLGAFAGTAMAIGPVVNDDLRADSLCIDPDGSNCGTTPAADDAEVRLEADTVRVRFLDTTAGNTTEDGLGNSWSLLANDYIGAGEDAQNYFGFTLRSVDPTPTSDGNNIVSKHVLRLGPSSSTTGTAGAVAIGGESELLEGVVSVGSQYVQRRLVHVAAAMQDTDALIKRQLEEGLAGSVDDITDQLDALEAEVAALESRVGIGGGGSGNGSGSSGGGSSGGGGGLMGVPTLAFLAALLGTAWRRRTVAV